MRWVPILLMVCMVSTALAVPLSAGTTMEVNVTTEHEESAGTYAVHVEADSGIEYSYEIEGNALLLHLTVFRGTPCQDVEVESEKTGDNEFEVIANVVEPNVACIQVIPEPATAHVKLSLDPAAPDVYVEIRREIKRVEPKVGEVNKEEITEIKMPEISVDCNTLLRRIRELEMNEPELAMRLKLVYSKKCVHPHSCEAFRERIEEVKEMLEKEHNVELAEELARLIRSYKQCVFRPEPVEMEVETVEKQDIGEIINKAIAIRQIIKESNEISVESIKAEIANLKRQLEALKRSIENIQKRVEIVAKKLQATLEVAPGRIKVEDEEINVPEAEIVIDENRGLKLKVDKNSIALQAEDAEAEVEVEVEVTPDGHVISKISGKPIRIDPKSVAEHIRRILKEVRKVALTDDGRSPKYVAVGTRKGRLLGLLPVKLEVEVEVDAEDGDIIAEKKPWWAFLVFP